MAEAKIRVFLADDHPLIRTGLSLAFENDPVVSIVGTADNGFEAIEKIEKLIPDIVLMDIDMPGLSGIAAIRELRKKFPNMMVLVLSTYNDRNYLGSPEQLFSSRSQARLMLCDNKSATMATARCVANSDI